MATEIERRFLVRDTGVVAALPGTAIVQAYLARSEALTVRVRIATPAPAAATVVGGTPAGQKTGTPCQDAAEADATSTAFLTIKSRKAGAVRDEFEYPLPLADAHALLALARLGTVTKTRYRLPVGDVVYEVDVFHGANAPLVIAEVELAAADAEFPRPHWLGQEITDDGRYANESLARLPFTQGPAAAAAVVSSANDPSR